jgi:E3 ubiquitin-protein ligase MYCBP2
MLSMVLALSGSTVGRQYLALQNELLLDLFSLLHTGSARVQRQVISLLRRVLPEIKPIVFASMLGISSLPPRDIIASNEKEDFDIHSVGILDVFLACIAKSLTVQTKVKGLVGGGSNKSVTTITLATAIHPRDALGGRWWLRGCLSRKLAECIIALLKDMTAGKLTDAWAVVTKNAIAQNILNLTRINERFRVPSECIKTPTLWIALASLCVLEQEHAERLSSSHWVNAGDQANGNQQSRVGLVFTFSDNQFSIFVYMFSPYVIITTTEKLLL